MSNPLISLTHHDHRIVIVTLNRPEKRNALNLDLIERLTDAVTLANANPALRVLMLRGNGPAFCAGLDLREAAAPGASEKSAEALARMYLAIGNSPLVTIAAAHGAAMGGGAGILAACDFVVADPDLKIAYPEVRRGLVAALVTCLLRRQLNDRTVREVILLGQSILAARALALGLISQIAQAGQAEAEAIKLAHEACHGAPGAISRSKRLLDELASRPFEDDLKLAMKYHLSSRNSAEAAEGIAAFMEKRAPNWLAEGNAG